MNDRTFVYSGPVLKFNKVVIPCFKVTTKAPTIGRAAANFEYKAKVVLKLAPTSKIDIGTKYIKEFINGELVTPKELI